MVQTKQQRSQIIYGVLMKKYYTDNIIQFPTQNTKQVQPAGKDVILFTPENFGQPGVKTMEFTFDLDGMVGAFESGNKDWMQMIPPTMLDQLVDAIDLDGSRKEINDVRDACTDIQLLAEEFPEHAGYIESKMRQLEKSLAFYIQNTAWPDC